MKNVLDETNHIPKEKCKDRRLYRLQSRNLAIGVYSVESGSFYGLRTKFGSVFVDDEIHWDDGPPYGTVQPLEELPEELPLVIINASGLGTGCSVCRQDAEFTYWPEGGPRDVPLLKVGGQWQHTDGTRCEGMHAVSRSNDALFEWLQTMEAKYVKPAKEPAR